MGLRDRVSLELTVSDCALLITALQHYSHVPEARLLAADTGDVIARLRVACRAESARAMLGAQIRREEGHAAALGHDPAAVRASYGEEDTDADE